MQPSVWLLHQGRARAKCLLKVKWALNVNGSSLSLYFLPFSWNLKSPASLSLTVCLLSVVLFLTWSFCLQACLSLQPVSSLSYPKFLCACPAGSLEVWWLGGSCWLDSRVLRAVFFGRRMDRGLGKSRGSKRAWRKWPLVLSHRAWGMSWISKRWNRIIQKQSTTVQNKSKIVQHVSKKNDQKLGKGFEPFLFEWFYGFSHKEFLKRYSLIMLEELYRVCTVQFLKY